MDGLEPDLLLTLSSTAESVVLVREMLAGVGEAAGLDPVGLNDLRIATTEACNNVVVHAYPAGPGPMEIEIRLERELLAVVVRDHGVGVADRGEDGDGLGLRMIDALAVTMHLNSVAGGGAELGMEFDAVPSEVRERPHELVGDRPAPAGSTATATLRLDPPALARGVLPRVMCALAGQADFSIARISDTQILADAFVAHASALTGENRLGIGASVASGDLELSISSLVPGRAEQLIEETRIDGLGRVIQSLTDRCQVTRIGSRDVLTLGMVDHR